MSKKNKLGQQLKGCSRWVLTAVAAAAAAHFADNPAYAGTDWTAALAVEAAPADGLSARQINNLPTWSLKTVAEAAAKRSIKGEKSLRYGNLMTELERRRAKRLAKEAEEARS